MSAPLQSRQDWSIGLLVLVPLKGRHKERCTSCSIREVTQADNTGRTCAYARFSFITLSASYFHTRAHPPVVVYDEARVRETLREEPEEKRSTYTISAASCTAVTRRQMKGIQCSCRSGWAAYQCLASPWAAWRKCNCASPACVSAGCWSEQSGRSRWLVPTGR